MWSREELKARAKLILKFNYWKAFLVTLIALFIGGGSSSISSALSIPYSFQIMNQMQTQMDSLYPTFYFSPALIMTITVFALIVSALGMAFYFFVSGPYQVSSAKYYLAQREQLGNLDNLTYAFTKGRYMNIVKASAWTYLFTWLWSLLFIIPGIVKGYAYRLIPFILAENPEMNYRQAMKLSINMTQGIKGDMFVMDLSFIGWYLLSNLVCGFGIFFILPYYSATIAEMYAFIKERAIVLNICPRETFMPNFGQMPPPPSYQPPVY